MNANAIERYVRLILGNLSMRHDYQSLLSGQTRMLVVEGKTDCDFFKGKLANNVICEIANKAFAGSSERINCKEAVKYVISGQTTYAKVLSNSLSDIKKLILYGFVDLDYEDSSSITNNQPRLFVSDTHDLETLMISTDAEILRRIEDGVISEEDVRKTLFYAYQIAVIRDALFSLNTNLVDLKWISGSNDIDFNVLIKDETIEVSIVLNYLSSKLEKPLSKNQMDTLCRRVTGNAALKKKLDKNNRWKLNWKEFDFETVPDYWKLVNGHDILSILRVVNHTIHDRFRQAQEEGNRRAFENVLINEYDFQTFKETMVYQKMRKENVIKVID